jgi:hypothetical protein
MGIDLLICGKKALMLQFFAQVPIHEIAILNCGPNLNNCNNDEDGGDYY